LEYMLDWVGMVCQRI